ncbi:MAG TPA: hypothetical protein ENH40_04170 [Nitrospirae bacterium]|nr:hypothetical protein [Nitrospirota bacterium]
MTTVTSKKSGRKYNITSRPYGTSNQQYIISYGGITLCSRCGVDPKLQSIEEGIEAADKRCDDLCIEIDNQDNK